jgi:hypothetical protein
MQAKCLSVLGGQLKLLVFWTFLKRIGLRIFAAGASLQTASWFYGLDDVVRLWLLDHRLFTTMCLIIYIIWDYLMYGGRDAEFYLQLKGKTERRKK